jgi:tetratricopeptide (TPR) repeat protein
MTKNCLLALVLTALTGFALPLATAADPATDAYKLRMAGTVDKAKALLEKTLTETPDNAPAHYELARTQLHIALGDMRQLAQGIADAHQSIGNAIKHDSQKVMYHTFAGHVAYFRAYMALQRQQPTVKEHFAEACRAFESALTLKSDYPQVMLYLVELHGDFPESAGADKAQAEQYAQRLKAMGDVWAGKARSILYPESCGVDFWKSVLAEDKTGNADTLEELGKAYLRDEQVAEAVKCFEQAVEHDAAKAYLFLDLSIYHTFRAMRAGEDEELLHTSLRSGDAAVTRYLESKPVQPMQAYALGVQSKYKRHKGDKEQAQELVNRAKALDPYFSKATGSPHPDLFIPPGEISQNHRYLMRPF